MLEPKDGDFVAYIDALQRASAERLAKQHVNVADMAFPTKKAQGSTFGEHPEAAAVSDGGGSVTGPFVRRDRDAKLVKAIVAGVVGAVFLLTWLGDGGLFPLIAGMVLLGYALPRLLAALRAQRVQRPAGKTLVDQVFGRSGNQTTGRGT